MCNNQLINWLSTFQVDYNFDTLNPSQPDSDIEGLRSRINMIDSRSNNGFVNIDIDHILPKIIGGKNPDLNFILDDIENLQLVHKHCHKIKSINLYSWNKEFKKELNKALKIHSNYDRFTLQYFLISHFITIITINSIISRSIKLSKPLSQHLNVI